MEKNTNKKTIIGWGVTILLPLIIGVIPVQGMFTEGLRKFFMITVFVILIIAFELIPKLAASILLPTLYLVTGLAPVEVAFGSWTNTTVWMVLGGLVFSAVLEECGLLERIAYFIITKCGGTYVGTVFACFVIGIILNLITFCNGWLVASVLVYGVCKAMGLKPSKESALLCFAGTIGATGCTVCLYYPGYFSIIEGSVREFIPDYTMTMTSSLKYNGWFILWCIICILILMKVYHTKDLKTSAGKEILEEHYKSLGHITGKEKRGIILVLILLVYLCSTRITGLPAAYGFMVISVLVFLPGIGIGNEGTVKKINFTTVFFVSSCLEIGIAGAAVGFGDFLTSIAVPALQGKGMLFVCLAFIIIGMIANLFMTPYAMLGGLSLPFAQMAVSLGMSPVTACMLLLYSCEVLFFPYESAGNLIMYEFGMMSMGRFVKEMTLKAVIMIVGFVVVMYPMWKLMGFL